MSPSFAYNDAKMCIVISERCKYKVRICMPKQPRKLDWMTAGCVRTFCSQSVVFCIILYHFCRSFIWINTVPMPCWHRAEFQSQDETRKWSLENCRRNFVCPLLLIMSFVAVNMYMRKFKYIKVANFDDTREKYDINWMRHVFSSLPQRNWMALRYYRIIVFPDHQIATKNMETRRMNKKNFTHKSLWIHAPEIN